uniref:HupE/UreJ family protein n=1 Tax=Pseudomonas aeruginosa TaxID=287 RepID=UPI0005B8FE5F
MKLPKLLAALALLAAPALAFAHPGHGEHGLVAGLAHPLTGLDHLLAMFAVAGVGEGQRRSGEQGEG